jgi:integrase
VRIACEQRAAGTDKNRFYMIRQFYEFAFKRCSINLALECDAHHRPPPLWVITQYLYYTSERLGATKTFNCHLTALNLLLSRFSPPTNIYQHPTYTALIHGLRRKMAREGKGRRRAAKTPLTLEQLKAMLTFLRAQADTAIPGVSDFVRLRADRDAVILLFGFFGFLRQSELIAMDVDAVTADVAHIHVYLPWTKTDQDWMGSDAVIPSNIQGINATEIWYRHAANMRTLFRDAWAGPVPAFPRLRLRDCKGSPLRLAVHGAISDIVTSAMSGMYAAVNAKMLPYVAPPPPGASYASHSLRRGADTAAEHIGLNPELRCVLGRWSAKSTSQPGYVHWGAARKAAILRTAFNK